MGGVSEGELKKTIVKDEAERKKNEREANEMARELDGTIQLRPKKGKEKMTR